MINDKWLMINDKWLMINDKWLMVSVILHSSFFIKFLPTS